MTVISNNLFEKGISEPVAGDVIRVNLAWVKSVIEAEEILKYWQGEELFPVYLDFPQGRTKPPCPTITIDDAIILANKYSDIVRYFAISNAENTETMVNLRNSLKKKTLIVPKIETLKGVAMLTDIVCSAETNMIMLDKDDLFISCDCAVYDYEHAVKTVREICKEKNIKILELQGIVLE
ncbi:MAG: hypothetical protein ACYDBV_12115 [Nitrospiria bacterium]